jgi:hypothetical protein
VHAAVALFHKSTCIAAIKLQLSTSIVDALHAMMLNEVGTTVVVRLVVGRK